MRFLKTATLAGAALCAAGAATAAPSSKFSATTSDHVLISETNSTEWVDVMTTGLKLPNQKDLFVQTAMECGLFTQTTVADSATDSLETDTADRATAEAAVMTRVRVTNVKTGVETFAHPDEIVLCARSQRLTALFNGICYDGSGDSEADGVVQYDECETNEELDLAVKTMNASAFNFILADLESGDHIITVQARVETKESTSTCSSDAEEGDLFLVDDLLTCTDDGNGDASAFALVGNGSMAVEEVRMIKGEDGVTEEAPATGAEEGSFFDYFFDFSN
ncbi:hypothetical protein [uncultured Abyssibacter sp.]|uniref:hypothetical protein n=1 Tax=uncultured Abyssibacter sp. TaxID=2320202 RepID=UPI0032B13EB3